MHRLNNINDLSKNKFSTNLLEYDPFAIEKSFQLNQIVIGKSSNIETCRELWIEIRIFLTVITGLPVLTSKK